MAQEHYIGLTQEEVEVSKKTYGENTLPTAKRKGFFRQYLASFSDPIIRILLIALVVNTLFLTSKVEIFGIAVAVFIATFVSTLSGYSSETAFLELKKRTENASYKVLRSAGVVLLPPCELVVGDVVYLEAGEKVPADCTVISGSLVVDQSALNGETAEVQKTTEKGGVGLTKANAVFQGTVVLSGSATVVISQVGVSTYYGKLAEDLQAETPESPLKQKLRKLAGSLSKIGYVSAGLVAVADLFNSFFIDNGMVFARAIADFSSPVLVFSRLLHAVTLAIAIVVVAVPEGLPMMIAVVLSSNMIKMKNDNVLVRKPVGIESSGEMNILFCDKTGTLTKGELSVVGFFDGRGNDYKSFKELPPYARQIVTLTAEYTSACKLIGQTVVGGNATDRAMLSCVLPFRSETPVSVLEFTPFRSETKYAEAYISRSGLPFGKDKIRLFKGASEKIAKRCKTMLVGDEILPFDLRVASKIQSSLTAKSMRVLAVAFGENDDDLTFVTFVAIRDDIRKNAPRAVKDAQNAGIQVVMITGDNPETANAIARETGLFAPVKNQAVGGYITLTGSELEEMTDEQVKEILPRLRVVARALPSDKSRLVKLAQSKGLVVGMTGDGINDAPALKSADVGFALGSGTEIAKDVGDVVILDDELSSITKAVRYGRTVFKSIRKFIIFQLTMNFCAVGISLIAPFIGFDTPVTVIQMLWINIIMDSLASLAFAGEPALNEYMDEPPVKKDEPVLTKDMCKRILCSGAYTVGLCLLFLILPVFKRLYGYNANPLPFQTAFFTLFVFSGIFGAFNARTKRINLLSHLKENKTFTLFILLVFVVQILLVCFGGTVFRTTPLKFTQLLSVFLLSSTVIPVDLLRKTVEKKVSMKARKNTNTNRNVERRRRTVTQRNYT